MSHIPQLINRALDHFHADKASRFTDPIFLIRLFEAEAEVALTIEPEQANEIEVQLQALTHEFPLNSFTRP